MSLFLSFKLPSTYVENQVHSRHTRPTGSELLLAAPVARRSQSNIEQRTARSDTEPISDKHAPSPLGISHPHTIRRRPSPEEQAVQNK